MCNFYHIIGHIKQYHFLFRLILFLGSNLAISFEFQIFFYVIKNINLFPIFSWSCKTEVVKSPGDTCLTARPH